MRNLLQSCFRPRIATGLAVMFLAGIVGCESTGTASTKPTAETRRAVVAWGPHGGTPTVILEPTHDQHPGVLAGSPTRDLCAGCQAASTEYFRTGVLPPQCPVCHSKLTPVSGQN